MIEGQGWRVLALMPNARKSRHGASGQHHCYLQRLEDEERRRGLASVEALSSCAGHGPGADFSPHM
jgi:hypothetical protein